MKDWLKPVERVISHIKCFQNPKCRWKVFLKNVKPKRRLSSTVRLLLISNKHRRNNIVGRCFVCYRSFNLLEKMRFDLRFHLSWNLMRVWPPLMNENCCCCCGISLNAQCQIHKRQSTQIFCPHYLFSLCLCMCHWCRKQWGNETLLELESWLEVEGLTFKYGNLCLNSRGPAIEVIASFSVEGRDKTVAPPPLLLSSMPQMLKSHSKSFRTLAIWHAPTGDVTINPSKKSQTWHLQLYFNNLSQSTLVVCVIQPLGDHSRLF